MSVRLTRDSARQAGTPAGAITAGLILTAAAIVAQAASQWIDFRLLHLQLRLLDSDHHASVFGAASIIAQAVAAAALWSRAARTKSRAGLLAATLLGTLTVARALMRYEPLFEHYDVPLSVAPLAVVFVVVCRMTFDDPTPARAVVWASLALLVCSFALHQVGPQADAVRHAVDLTQTWAYQATGMVKHGAELAGWMLLATGLAAGGLATPPRRSARATPSS